MRVLFLNQYFPPDPAPTGVLLKELADDLEATGHEVDFASGGQEYRRTQIRQGRLRREILALAHIFFRGLRRPRPDVILSATSPPCLLLVATLLALWHRAKSVHWVMDLYPEIASELGEIPRGGLTRILQKMMGWAYRRAAAVVALDADMAERLRPYGVEAKLIRPWVFTTMLATLARSQGAPQPPWTWIYSGNLGRAHEWQTLLKTQALLEKRGAEIRLLFQGGGPSRAAAEVCARDLGLKNCAWADYVPEGELPAALLNAQVLVATQLPAARGLLWPSKLGLLLSLPRSILWVGPDDGAIAGMLRAVPSAGVFSAGEAKRIADWLLAQKASSPPESAALDPAEHRRGALAAWRELLTRLT